MCVRVCVCMKEASVQGSRAQNVLCKIIYLSTCHSEQAPIGAKIGDDVIPSGRLGRFGTRHQLQVQYDGI